MKKLAAVFLVLSALAPFSFRSALADDDTVLDRLKSIEEKQDRILQDMEALKSEVQIVKIRVSSR